MSLPSEYAPRLPANVVNTWPVSEERYSRTVVQVALCIQLNMFASPSQPRALGLFAGASYRKRSACAVATFNSTGVKQQVPQITSPTSCSLPIKICPDCLMQTLPPPPPNCVLFRRRRQRRRLPLILTPLPEGTISTHRCRGTPSRVLPVGFRLHGANNLTTILPSSWCSV